MMQTLKSQITVMCLAAVGLTFTACSSEEEPTTDTKMSAATSGSKDKAAAGSAASKEVAPGDQIGNSAAAPQGDCPKGFACTRVLFPENERVCMKPGDTLAPACSDKDQCPDMPEAGCVDTGTAGKVCTQFCKVSS